MRIRRRPQPAASDLAASTAPQIPPPNAARNRGWLLAGEDEDREARLLRASADLAQESGASRRLALPQDDNAAAVPVVDRGGRSMSMSMGAPRGAADVGRMRISAVNGDGGYVYDPAEAEARRETSNGSVRPAASAPAPPVAAAAKDEGRKQQQQQQQAKKRRGPAVLLEGSRCSRVNGRGWRCSQPTLVGYSLCEHHLGKGRTRTAAGAALARGAAGVGRLGRTEHGAAAAAATAPPLPKAEGPTLPGC